MLHKPHLIPGSSNPTLTQAIAKEASLQIADTNLSKFANQELRIQLANVGLHSAVVQSFSSPVNSHIIEMLLIVDAASRLKSKDITGIIPYFGYSKQDKVFQSGEPLSAKVIGKILQSSKLSRIITIDLHNPSISGYIDLPMTNLSAIDIFVEHLQPNLESNAIIVSPDLGAIKTASLVAQKLDLPIAHINKQRDLKTGKVTIKSIDQNISGKHIYIFDDMIATGSTLIQASQFLKKQGATSIQVCATHHLFIPGVQQKIDASAIDHLYISDTVQKPDHISSTKLTIVSVANLIAAELI